MQSEEKVTRKIDQIVRKTSLPKLKNKDFTKSPYTDIF